MGVNNRDERVLWQLRQAHRTVSCVLRTCCAGAELQVRSGSEDADEEIILRELYPTTPDLYERARELEQDYRSGIR